MKTLPIFDGHNDTLLRLQYPQFDQNQDLLIEESEAAPPRSFFDRHEDGHLDLPRIREGGLSGGMFAVFVRPNPATVNRVDFEPEITETGYDGPILPAEELGYSQQAALAMMATLFRTESESEGQVKVVRTADEISACFADNTLAMVLHFEGAEPIDPGLDALEVFYRAGLRSVGIVWSRPNTFGHGVPFRYPHSPDVGPGLTDAGKALVRACNRLGIVVDMAHLNEQGFWDVNKLSDAPLVVSHSAAHAICPSCRNLTDAQLDAIQASNGIVGVTFCTTDVRADGKWRVDAPLTQIICHLDYIAGRIGIEHVGFGSDFDGATIPKELGDVTGMPKLIDALRQRGYDEAALRKIAYENWLRVLRETWKA